MADVYTIKEFWTARKGKVAGGRILFRARAKNQAAAASKFMLRMERKLYHIGNAKRFDSHGEIYRIDGFSGQLFVVRKQGGRK